METMPEVLTVRDAAREADIGEYWLRCQIKTGKLKCYWLGKRMVILRSDFDAWNKGRKPRGFPRSNTDQPDADDRGEDGDAPPTPSGDREWPEYALSNPSSTLTKT